MLARLFLAAAILSLTLGSGAAAGCVPTTSESVVEAGGFYVAGNARSLFCDPTCFFDIWVYEESNGIDGLQRRDEIRDDTCGIIAGDTIHF